MFNRKTEYQIANYLLFSLLFNETDKEYKMGLMRNPEITNLMAECSLLENTEVPPRLCECQIYGLRNHCQDIFSPSQLEIIFIRLYFQLVIDQALYYILLDSRNKPGFVPREDIYEKYNNRFRFIKAWGHGYPGQLLPVNLLRFNISENYQTPIYKSHLLIKWKKYYWDKGVKTFLLEAGYNDVAEECEQEFLNDLNLRYGSEDIELLNPNYSLENLYH